VIDETSPLLNILEYAEDGSIKGFKSNYTIRFFLIVQGTDSCTSVESHDYKMYTSPSFIFEEQFIDMIVPSYQYSKYPEAALLQFQNLSITTKRNLKMSVSDVLE